MNEEIGRANMDYMVRLANDPAWAARELVIINQFCADGGALYDGKPVHVPIKPHFISVKQRTILQRGVSRISTALEKFIKIWLESDELQAMWDVTPEEMALYKVDPGYTNSIQVARFDAFLEGMKLKFLEFNCDSPGGTGYADVIHRAFLDMFDRNEMGNEYDVSDRSRLLHLGETIQKCYGEWRIGKDVPEQPFVVVSDWRDISTLPDIDITINHLMECGMDATFADPRDFELRDDGLYLNAKRVDVVYKRVISKELALNPDASALCDGYKQGKVCMLNSPRSVIVGNKKIMAAIRRPEILAQFNGIERDAIREYVPWTEILDDRKAEFHGFLVDLRDFVTDNKDQLVLKAAQSYGGRDVFLGFEASEEDWKDLLEKHIGNKNWIVQQLVSIPKELFPVLHKDSVQMDLLNVNINPLAFSGTYAGSYSRLSKKNVINVSSGGGMTAAMTIELVQDE